MFFLGKESVLNMFFPNCLELSRGVFPVLPSKFHGLTPLVMSICVTLHPQRCRSCPFTPVAEVCVPINLW